MKRRQIAARRLQKISESAKYRGPPETNVSPADTIKDPQARGCFLSGAIALGMGADSLGLDLSCGIRALNSKPPLRPALTGGAFSSPIAERIPKLPRE